MAIGDKVNLAGYKLTFDDEFNQFSSNGESNYWEQPSAGEHGTWDTSYSYGENTLPGEAETYINQSSATSTAVAGLPDTIAGGVLDIHVAPVAGAAQGAAGSYTSGVITTYHSFAQEYGYFEMRAELPAGAGMWPAFWMLPTVHTWPPELDVLEAFGATNANGEGGATQIHDAVHTTDSSDPSSGGWNGTGGANLYTSYNTFGVQWTPTTLNFFFDGVEYATAATPADFHQQMFMLANAGVGGSWAGNATGESADMKIDYIRAFSDDGSNPAIVQQGTSSPDGGGVDFYGATDADGNGALSVATGGSQVTQAPVVTVGAGNDTLDLRISEDETDGDAQFTVSVDGVQVGGTQTARYDHADGMDQDFLFKGSWGSGQHTVSVDFLNDLYLTDPAHYVFIGDRNLYVDGASYDGTTAAADTLALTGNGTQTLTVSGITPVSAVAAASVPVIGGLSAATDTGASQTDGLTSNPSPALMGKADPGGSVSVYDSGQLLGSTVADASGIWSFVPSSRLLDGAHAFTAVGVNSAGQASAPSPSCVVTIDTAAPQAASVTASASSTPAHAGQAISFAVATSEAVSVSLAKGSPTLALSDGGTATYDAAHSTATSLAFATVVSASQSSTDLTVAGLSLNGAVVQDAAGNAMMASSAIKGSDTGIVVAGAAPAISIGSGGSVLELDVDEDAYQGDAQFTLSVDGQQVGGILSASALAGSGVQAFDVHGNWSAGAHTASVDFLNDLYAGSPATDRNLYVTAATYDGSPIAGSGMALMSAGTQAFSFQATDPTVVVGSGADTLALSVSEDAYQGDAQFTISVDGKQVGGTLTATAPHGLGAFQTVDVLGSFSGSHTASVNFLNDLYAGSPSTDRNLYVTGATLDGAAVPNSALTEMAPGPLSFSFQGATPLTTIGSGPDTLALSVSEDAYQGDAQFTVSVDGKQVGGTLTATAPHGSGATQTIAVKGAFSGSHAVSVNFLNDLYGGSPSTDRNLYVTGATLDGTAVPNSTLTEMAAGPQSFGFAPTAAQVTPLTLMLSEDAYQGDAKFIYSIDGGPSSAAQSVTASHAAGASQAFSLPGLTTGLHDVAVSFVNDLYGGSPSTDRNLYVNAVDLNNVAVPGATASIMAPTTSHFELVVPPH